MNAAPSVGDRITEAAATLTRTERRIAQALLQQYPVLGLQTLARVADAAQTTAPSVLRLVNKLGFSGYADFQEALRLELQPSEQSAQQRHEQQRTIAQNGSLTDFAEATIRNIRRAIDMAPPHVFDAVAILLADRTRSVHCIGGRFSHSLAESLYNLLIELRPRVAYIAGQTETWPARLLDLGKKDIVIAFDFRRYQDDVVRFCETAAKQGATIVVFTDEWMSPICRSATHILVSPTEVPSLYDSTIPAVMQVEALVGAVAQRLGEAPARRIANLESFRAITRSA